MRIFVFGNEFLSEDNMAYLVARHLAQTQEWRDSGHEFVFCRAPEELLDEASPVTILDVAKTNKIELSKGEIDELSEIVARYTVGYGILEILLNDRRLF